MKTSTTTTLVQDQAVSRSTAMTIAATGKAFRTLIDGIYADKVLAPVRELMTNAYDAHVMGDQEDTPFHVTVPTGQDLTFAVRDYGTGMDHDTMVGLYTTLFESSKDQTNDQVGMLGLGSKSPFAYTDQFTVRAFDGTEVREYLAFMVNDAPHLGDPVVSPSTEPRGIEVSFEVREGDTWRFERAIEQVLYGFVVRPTTSQEIAMATPTFEGTGFEVYKDADLTAFNIRMGCVVYPLSKLQEVLRGTEFENLRMPYGLSYVVDVPIGTVDVTTNREDISYNDTSISNLTMWVEMAIEEHRDGVLSMIEEGMTQLEKCEVLASIDYEWRRMFNLPLQLTLTLMGEDWDNETKRDTLMRRRPGYFFEMASSRKDLSHTITYDSRGSVTFILDDDTTVRRRSRVRDFAKHRGGVFVIPAGHAAVAMPRLKKLWGIKDEQFIKVEDLEDPGPPARNGSSRGLGQTSDKVLKEEIASGKPWVHRMRDRVWTTGRKDGGVNYAHGNRVVTNGWAQANGIENLDDVVFLTDAQVARIKPDPERSLGVVLRKAWEAADYTETIRQAAMYWAVFNAIQEDMVGYDDGDYWDYRSGKTTRHVAAMILDAQGFEAPEKLSHEITNGMAVVEGLDISTMAADTEKYSVDEELVQELKVAIRRQYPGLYKLNLHDVEEIIRKG